MVLRELAMLVRLALLHLGGLGEAAYATAEVAAQKHRGLPLPSGKRP